MATFFISCALFGGTLLICQTLMGLVGFGADHDLDGDADGDTDAGGLEGADADGGDLDHELGHLDVASHGGHGGGHQHSSTWFFGMITLRTVIAGITFFGLAGMSALTRGFDEKASFVIAAAAGFAAIYAVHMLMTGMRRLNADGTVRIDRAVGMTGNVYLRVPGSHQGAGKILLNLQNRTVELTAWTEQAELPTGTTVVVTRVVGPDSVEVMSAVHPVAS